MKALVVADGDVPPRATLDRLLGDEPALVVAADGGATKAAALGRRPDVVVGDGDSLSADALAQLRAEGVELVVHPSDKDESDTELALRLALERGADDVLLVGAFGGSRIEHMLANVLLLCLPQIGKARVRLADAATTIVLAQPGAPVVVDGATGDFVSLLPLTPRASGVTTRGLAYALQDAALDQGPARGLSNVMLGPRAEISLTSGRLLVVHTRSSS